MGFRDQIKHEAIRRRIPNLVHFTKAQNLPNIVTHGLLSRRELTRRGLKALPSDHWRLDENDDAISVSISAVNCEMLRAKHRKDEHAIWVILFLDRSILWTHSCRFCCRNAARNEMKNHHGFLGGVYGFRRMFSEDMSPPRFQGTSYRLETNIPDHLTTNPDAEVQVFGSIAPEAILGAWIDRVDLENAVQLELDRLPGSKREVAVQDFTPRFSNGYFDWG